MAKKHWVRVKADPDNPKSGIYNIDRYCPSYLAGFVHGYLNTIINSGGTTYLQRYYFGKGYKEGFKHNLYDTLK